MPVTPLYALPYPSLSDAPHGPSQLQALAEEVEAELQRIDAVDASQAASITALQQQVDFPSFMLRRTSALTVTASTFTAVGFNAEDNDSHGGHDNATNNDRYTVQKTGLYLLTGGTGWVGNAVNTRISRLTRNGGVIAGSAQGLLATEATNFTIVSTRVVLVACVAGDILRLEVWQNSGGNLDTGTTDYAQPHLAGHWVKP